jgi:RNA polymerase sigma-70 factor (ECF subfamily)
LPQTAYSYIVIAMADLTEALRAGDVSAFEAVFQDYRKMVFKTAYLMTGRKEEAEDILQEVFVSVWRSRNTFNPEKGKLTTWIYRITVNQCLSRRRRKKLSLLSLEEKNINLPDTKPAKQPEEILVTRLEYERLVKAMNVLDSRHRSVLILRYFNDLSYDEIAQVVGIPLGTVKSRVSQALRSLRTQMSIQQPEASA